MNQIELTSWNDEAGVPRHERADAAANRALILSTAERLFTERGVEAVCMSEIADAAGVGKGTLYRRFANKSELCLALMDTQMAEFQNRTLAEFHAMADEGASHLDRLTYFLCELVAFTDIHSPLLVEVERGGLIRPDLRLNLPHQWQFMTVNALLGAAARYGELRPDLDTDYVADVLLAPLQVDLFRHQRDVRGFSTERIADGLSWLVNMLAR